jgi:hypothetical protein
MNQQSSEKSKTSKSKKQSISAIRRDETELKKETARVPFECPLCHWIMRSEKPDDKHPIPSVAKSRTSGVNGDVVIQNHVCRNPRCRVSFVVCWSDPKDFYKRI